MVNSRQMFKSALLVGVGLVVLSFAVYNLLPDHIAPYALFPGIFAGLFAATILAAVIRGNAHGADWTTIWVITTSVNFAWYVFMTYAALSLWFKNLKKR
jgi:hypothetical protein